VSDRGDDPVMDSAKSDRRQRRILDESEKITTNSRSVNFVEWTIHGMVITRSAHFSKSHLELLHAVIHDNCNSHLLYNGLLTTAEHRLGVSLATGSGSRTVETDSGNGYAP